MANVTKIDDRFHIKLRNGTLCEVSFDNDRDAQTIAYYLRIEYRDGRDSLRDDLTRLLEIEGPRG